MRPLTYFLLLYKLTNLKKYRENECVSYFRESKFANSIIDNFCLNFHVFILLFKNLHLWTTCMERIIKTIRFRPKREYLDNIVEQFETVTKKAMAEGSIDSYFTAILDEEILYVGIFNSKEDSVGITSKGIEWLNKRQDLLETFTESGKLVLVETGTIK